jgi:hypothetical protein
LEAESEVGAGPLPPDELLELLEEPLDDPLELLEPPELEPLESLEVPESSPPELEAPELLDPLEPPPDPPLEPSPMSDGDDEGEPHATRSNAKTLGAIVDMRFMGFLGRDRVHDVCATRRRQGRMRPFACDMRERPRPATQFCVAGSNTAR